jgi:CBS domain-containing protein
VKGVSKVTKYVRDLMTRDVEAVTPEMPALWAAKRMAHKRIRHLVVNDTSGRVTGIISDRDILKHLSPWLSKFNRQGSFRLSNPDATCGT